MSNLPSSIYIFGQDIKVKVVKKIPLQEDDPDEDCIGLFCPKNSVIYIDASLSEDRQLAVLFHEVMEAIKSAYELNLSHKDLNIIGQAFYTMFRDCAFDIQWRKVVNKKKTSPNSKKTTVRMNTEYEDIGEDIKIIHRP